VGYAVADAAIVALANRFREPFNVNLLAQSAAVAALSDISWVREKVAECKLERERVESQLTQWGVLGGHSYGNFVLLRHKSCQEILRLLEDHGIIPRPLAAYGMADFLRISVGTTEENSEFLSVLEDIIAGLKD
jgi:histidinol-phosphate aminotransferase